MLSTTPSRLIHQRTGLALGARIVHGRVKPAEPLHRKVHQVAYFVFLPNVRREEFRFRTECTNLQNQLFAFWLAPPGYDQPRAFASKRQCCGSANAGQRTGHQND
jgi:hypothetical protein